MTPHPSRQYSLSPPRLLIVFEDRPASGLLRWLEPGFRHCFCLIEAQDGWILLDPLKGSIRIEMIHDVDLECMTDHFIATGRNVVIGRYVHAKPPRTMTPRLLSCVEIIKRVAAVHAPGVWTPKQLFTLLIDQPFFHRLTVLPDPSGIDSDSK